MNLKTLCLVCVAAVATLFTASPVFAQQISEKIGGGHAPFYGPHIGAGLGAGLTIIGAALGFGKIGAAALESMARQPETAGKVQTAMLIIAALLEGATFFALIICIILAGK